MKLHTQCEQRPRERQRAQGPRRRRQGQDVEGQVQDVPVLEVELDWAPGCVDGRSLPPSSRALFRQKKLISPPLREGEGRGCSGGAAHFY